MMRFLFVEEQKCVIQKKDQNRLKGGRQKSRIWYKSNLIEASFLPVKCEAELIITTNIPSPQGALVAACADDTLHLWNLRQRRPAILHSLKFNRER